MPDSELSRRTLLQAAGGVTFMALARGAAGMFVPTTNAAAEPSTGAVPLFIALPYIQPGPSGGKLVDGEESIVIAWQTNGVPAKITVSYGKKGDEHQAEVKKTSRWAEDTPPLQQRVNFAATLTGLHLGTRYRYRVDMNGEKLLEGYFTTRKPRGTKTRFVAFGDNSYGDISDRAIAYQSYRAMPDFVMNTGDNVYESGKDDEYARYFFPVYNADDAGPRIGAPLLRSVPFYTVMANHDINSHDDLGLCASVDKDKDTLGYYTNMHLPLNGLKSPTPTRLVGAEERMDDFLGVAGSRFPQMANYSFDYGDVHFLCLDSNDYVDPTRAELQDWIAQDLSGTDAIWKVVVFHHPSFNAGAEHYHEQHMRVLSPIFEKHGVDLTLSGHEHTYQRTRPLKFEPKDETQAKNLRKGDRYVPGTFTIDRNYDGKSITKPEGVIYLTTGAGGKHMYDPQMNDDPKNWLHAQDDHADYVARFVSDRHSLTVIDVEGRTLDIRQIDEWGGEVDRFRVTKA